MAPEGICPRAAAFEAGRCSASLLAENCRSCLNVDVVRKFRWRSREGSSPQERRRVRQERSRALVEALGIWLREQHARLSPASQVAKAIAYSLNCWVAKLRTIRAAPAFRLCEGQQGWPAAPLT